MQNNTLVTNKIVKQNKYLKENQKIAKKTEKRIRLFDFRTKIYSLVKLESEELLDLTNSKIAEKREIADIPTDPSIILDRINSCGIVGLGGGGFPTGQKIEAVATSSVKEKHFLINSVGCDPGLLHDEWLLKNRWEQIALGISAVCRVVPFQKVVVASRLPLNPSAFESRIKIDFSQLDYFYPLGEEHILLQKVFGIHLEQQNRPSDIGVLVLNVQTVITIGQAAVTNEKYSNKYLTVADLTNGRARIVKVSLGSDAALVINNALGVNKTAPICIGDGVMNSRNIAEDEKIGMLTNLIVYAKPIKFADSSSCIDCGICQKKCPANIPIGGLIKTVKYGQKIPKDIIDACIGCNSCTYFCKAGINTKSFICCEDK